MRNPRVWVGLAVSALFMALLLRQVDRDEVLTALAGVHVWWLPLAVAVEFAALWVRGVRWRLILDSTVRIRDRDAVSILLIGYAANNVLPLRAGELVRAQLLYTRHGAGRMATIGTIVVERIFDVLVLALFLASAVAAIEVEPALRQSALLLLLLAATAAGCVAVLAAWPRGADLLVRALGVLPPSVRPRARSVLGSFLGGLGALRGGPVWAGVAASSVMTWGLEATAYWLVGIAFGLPVGPAAFLAVCGAANLALAVPSTAGGIGPFEYLTGLLLRTYGAAAAVSAAYALVLHALLLAPVVVVGVILLWRHHLGIGALMRALQAGAAGTREAAEK